MSPDSVAITDDDDDDDNDVAGARLGRLDRRCGTDDKDSRPRRFRRWIP